MTNWQKFLKNMLGGFSGDGGAAQDDSVKASLDLAHTDLDAIIAAGAAADGLIYYGTVTTANTTSNFKVSGLAGKGTNVFNDVYYCHVIEADNAAPEGETKKVSAYTTGDGDITVGAVFSAAPEVGDQVIIIHESLALMFMHADATLARVVDDSIIAHILAVDGDVSDYNDNTMSLEALNIDLDAIIADVGTVDGYHDIPGANVVTNAQMRDVIGNKTDAAVTAVGTENSLIAYQKGVLNQIPAVSDVVIYPVAEHAATTEIADDGTSPAFYADAGAESGTATLENNPNVHWSEDIDFEPEGSIDVISIFAELRWEHKTSGGTAYSKVQMSRDGGVNWVDMTDSIAETNVAYQNKTRIGVGRFVTTIVAGANQLEFRLVSWEAGGATSSAKIRSDSYMRLTYRKS